MTATQTMLTPIEAFLADPNAYPDQPSNVEMRETHISRVFLTDRFAYKLKKPVRFDFLDFSTEAMRRRACEDELELNRRLSSGVYLEVVPIRQTSDGTFSLAGQGVDVDWLVKMRRLDDSKTLEQLIRSRRVTDHHIRQVATRLADFYSQQAPKVTTSDGFLRALTHHIESNRSDLVNLMPNLVTTIRASYAAQMRFLHVFADVFNDRVCDGRIVDGHGDLQPEHIYLEGRPQIIDCCEFSSEYRRNDIVDELAFLAMECDRLDAGAIGQKIMQAYVASSGDRPSNLLVNFYKCYRASVRAKVTALRQRSAHGRPLDSVPSPSSYAALASQYARRLGPPIVVTVGGVMGSGKSTLCHVLAERVGGTVLHTDQIRRDTQQDGPSDIPATEVSYGTGIYTEAQRRKVYDVMFRRAADALNSEATVFLDGTFDRAAVRQLARKRLGQAGATVIHVECQCAAAVARRRIVDRWQTGDTHSDARPHLLDVQLGKYEAYRADEHPTVVDTTDSIDRQVTPVMQQIRAAIQRSELTQAAH